jgi:hypothetical protein
MEVARSVIETAFCFDAVVFGGYVRDVIVCQSNEFRDIDILWLKEKESFYDFLRVLSMKHEVTGVREVAMSSYCKRPLIHFHVDTLPVDCVLCRSSFESWKTDVCDLSCNLFYMSRTVQVGVKYIPDFLKFHSNPIQKLIDMTRNRKYRTIQENADNRQVTKVLFRCIDLAGRGWFHEGTFARLGVLTSSHRRMIGDFAQIQDEKVISFLDEKLPSAICEKVTSILFGGSESSSVDDRGSVNQENADSDGLD